jgi:hypothetical protein
MKAETKLPFMLKFTLTVSLFGLLTTLLMVVYPPSVKEDFSLRRPLIGSIFILICAGGIVGALSPRKCSTPFNAHTPKPMLAHVSKTGASIGFKGHHMDCGRFSAHVVRFRGISYCAACTGLGAGAAIGVVMTVPYFFFGFGMDGFSVLSVVIGQLGPLLGFIQFRLKGWVRLVANASFVLGSSLIVTGMDQYTGSFFVDLYVIGLVTFWILTRISISQWDHSRICLICNYQCK